MTVNFGITTEIKNEDARDIKIASDTVLLMAVAEGSGANGTLSLYESPAKALADYPAQASTTAKDGAVRAALRDIQAQNVNCKIVLAKADKAATALTKAKTDLKTELGIKPDIILAPGFCAEDKTSTTLSPVASKLSEVASYFNCIGLYDMNASNITEANTELKSLAKRIFPVYGTVKTVRDGKNYDGRPLSAYVAGLMANNDASRDFGWGYSPSNKAIYDIIGGGVEFEPGQNSMADELRQAGVNCLIREQGFRLWGDNITTETTSQPFSDVKRLRIFDKVSKSVMDGLFWAVDQNALDVLPYVKDSVQALLNRLKGSNVLLGFDIYWDENLNTNTEIAAGRFYLKVNMQDMPSVKRLKITFSYTNRYGGTLLEILNN